MPPWSTCLPASAAIIKALTIGELLPTLFAALLPDDTFRDESVTDWAIGRNKPYRKSVLYVSVVCRAAAAVATDVCTGIRGSDVHAIRDDSGVSGRQNQTCIRVNDFPIQRLLGELLDGHTWG